MIQSFDAGGSLLSLGRPDGSMKVIWCWPIWHDVCAHVPTKLLPPLRRADARRVSWNQLLTSLVLVSSRPKLFFFRFFLLKDEFKIEPRYAHKKNLDKPEKKIMSWKWIIIEH